MQTQRDFGGINHPPIGERISSEAPKTPDEKIDLFLKLFACRTDVFPKFWENKKTGKKGYSPVCSNEWVREICRKPKIKCTDCKHKAFKQLDEKSISDHLTGKITLAQLRHLVIFRVFQVIDNMRFYIFFFEDLETFDYRV